MKLSEELFTEIREALVPKEVGQKTSRETDRRGTGRLPVEMEVTIEPYGVAKGLPRTARLVNFSISGISIIDNRALRANEQFVVHLPRSGGTVPLICTVKNCRVRSDGLFGVGAEFTSHAEKSGNCRPMTRGVEGIGSRQTDMELLRGRAQPEHFHQVGDKRRSQRLDKSSPVRIIPFTAGRCGAAIQGEMRDISRSGICVIHAQQMDRGQDFLMQPLNEPGPLWKLYTVVSCRAMAGGRYRIGAAFKSNMQCADTPRGLASRVRNWLRAERRSASRERA